MVLLALGVALYNTFWVNNLSRKPARFNKLGCKLDNRINVLLLLQINHRQPNRELMCTLHHLIFRQKTTAYSTRSQ